MNERYCRIIAKGKFIETVCKMDIIFKTDIISFIISSHTEAILKLIARLHMLSDAEITAIVLAGIFVVVITTILIGKC